MVLRQAAADAEEEEAPFDWRIFRLGSVQALIAYHIAFGEPSDKLITHSVMLAPSSELHRAQLTEAY